MAAAVSSYDDQYAATRATAVRVEGVLPGGPTVAAVTSEASLRPGGTASIRVHVHVRAADAAGPDPAAASGSVRLAEGPAAIAAATERAPLESGVATLPLVVAPDAGAGRAVVTVEVILEGDAGPRSIALRVPVYVARE